MCDLEDKRCLPHWVVILCPFPLFHMYLSLQCVLMLLCRRSTLLSPPCHINCHLQASKFRGWTCLFMEKKKNHRSIAFFQDYNIWGRYIYLACINVCMSGVFFREYIASWAHDIHPLLNYSIIMFLFKKISILFFFLLLYSDSSPL